LVYARQTKRRIEGANITADQPLTFELKKLVSGLHNPRFAVAEPVPPTPNGVSLMGTRAGKRRLVRFGDRFTGPEIRPFNVLRLVLAHNDEKLDGQPQDVEDFLNCLLDTCWQHVSKLARRASLCSTWSTYSATATTRLLISPIIRSVF